MTQPTGAIPPPAGIDAPGASASTREFLTFALGTEECALEILKVQEIRRYDAGTRIANTPPFILVDIEKPLTSEELALAGGLVQ
jgi:purine-binding chemotaxis protein CheW